MWTILGSFGHCTVDSNCFGHCTVDSNCFGHCTVDSNCFGHCTVDSNCFGHCTVDSNCFGHCTVDSNCFAVVWAWTCFCFAYNACFTKMARIRFLTMLNNVWRWSTTLHNVDRCELQWVTILNNMAFRGKLVNIKIVALILLWNPIVFVACLEPTEIDIVE